MFQIIQYDVIFCEKCTTLRTQGSLESRIQTARESSSLCSLTKFLADCTVGVFAKGGGGCDGLRVGTVTSERIEIDELNLIRAPSTA
jgi:hypothetical protein